MLVRKLLEKAERRPIRLDQLIDGSEEPARPDDKLADAFDGDAAQADDAPIVHLACENPPFNVTNIFSKITRGPIASFSSSDECIEHMKTITSKFFLILEGVPSASVIEALEPLKLIDSVFVCTPLAESIAPLTAKPQAFIVNWCENSEALVSSIVKSREGLQNQAAAFSMYNQKEKATRDLTKEAGSFLFFQLFKTVLKSMPKTAQAKKTMINACRHYYRGNVTETRNIDDFERDYRSADAIPWYTKETFVYKFINKALRTEDVNVLYQFRFYIMDLSEQLELKCAKLKETLKAPLMLYRGQKLSFDEVANFQRSTGNLISTNGYLSTSSDYDVAFGFATKAAKREGVARALFEYQVDLKEVEKIVVADIREFSAFPDEAEVLVDIGASFQIESCIYNETEDLWHVRVHATDKGAMLAAEYMEYQKKKMAEANIELMFGNLLLEMGEYAKAEKYFDTILETSNPNDEEIACIFFNIGRSHRLKGNFERAIKCYTRAFQLHINSRPQRTASAAKTLNGIGVVYTDLGDRAKAEACFQHVMKLYKKSIPMKHIDVAGTLINAANIHCDRGDFAAATLKYNKAKKIYDRSLPPGHPNRAVPRVNLANVYLAAGDHDMAFKEYSEALKLQETSLPADHPDIARTLHNLAVVQMHRDRVLEAKEYLDRAESTASRTLPVEHPLIVLLNRTKDAWTEKSQDYTFSRF